MVYILVYLFVTILCIGEPFVKKTQKWFFLFIGISIIGLFQSLRWRTGTDWEPYSDFFFHANNHYRTELKGFEWGYTQLNILVRYFTKSFTVFLFIECFLNLYFITRFARAMPVNNICIVLLVFFASAVFPIRYTLASSIILCSYKYIIDKQFLKFLFFFVLALSIHRSIIVFFPIYFLVRKEYSIRLLLGFYIAAIILGFLLESYFGDLSRFISLFYSEVSESYQNKLNAYVREEIPEYGEMSLYRTLLSMINSSFFILLFYHFKKKFFKGDKVYTVLFNLYVFGIIFNRIFLHTIPDFVRVTSLFAGGFVILLLMIISKYSIKKQFLFISLLCIYYFVKYWGAINGLYADLFLPYYSIFSGVNRFVY